MRFFLLVFAFTIFPWALIESTRIFLIGDSIDRYIVEDWCHFKGDEPNCMGSQCTFWAQYSSVHSMAPYTTNAMCRMGNDSISFLQIFGSKPIGPYLHGINSGGNEDVDTKARIPYSMELYADRVGIPDMIIYHSAQWDIQLLYEVHGSREKLEHGELSQPHIALWNASLIEFEENLNNRVDEVISSNDRINKYYNRNRTDTTIGLRTAVWNAVGGPLLHAMNAIIRQTARDRMLTLFDLDDDVWGSVNWDYSVESKSILRDWIHPVPFYTSLTGEKLLGYRFSHNFEFRGVPESNFLSPIWLGQGPKPTATMKVTLIREKRTSQLPSREMDGLRLYSKRKLRDRRDYHARRRMSETAATQANENMHGTEFGIFYVDSRNGSIKRCGPISDKVRLYLRLSPAEVLHVSKAHWDLIPISTGIPQPLLDQSRTALETTQGNLFLVHNGQRRVIPNNQVLSGLGFDSASVIPRVDEYWVNLFTSLGPPIPSQ